MKRRFYCWLLAGAFCAVAANPAVSAPTNQTIILIRHGEKPPSGLGQLNCRGLNRALRLPRVIADQFGRPDVIIAPDPSKQKEDQGVAYNYVRPLQTVGPSAIAFGLPIDTKFGYQETAALADALDSPRYWNATLLVSWEHKELVRLARRLLAANGGNAKQVPRWRGDDFDSIYVVQIERDGPAKKATFALGRENLDGQPDICPGG